MPWPERDFTSRFLAGIVGGLVGALIGFGLAITVFRLIDYQNPPILAVTGGAAAASFVASFWFGDPAVRFLLRVVGSSRRLR